MGSGTPLCTWSVRLSECNNSCEVASAVHDTRLMIMCTAFVTPSTAILVSSPEVNLMKSCIFSRRCGQCARVSWLCAGVQAGSLCLWGTADCSCHLWQHSQLCGAGGPPVGLLLLEPPLHWVSSAQGTPLDSSLVHLPPAVMCVIWCSFS